MKFSVICPVYNSEKYLNECILSLINQSFLNWELILIDDGSNDNSGFICDEFASNDERITVIHTLNNGPYEARKAGLNFVSGDYVLFLDSDDYFYPHALDIISNEIIKNAKPDVIIFPFFSQKQNDKNSLEGQLFIECSDIIVHIRKLLLLNKINNLCSKCFSADVVKRSINRLPSMHSIIEEDLIMNLVLFDNVKSVKYISDALYFYRYVPTSTMNKRVDFEHFADTKINTKSTDILLDYAKKWGLYEDTYLDIYCNKIKRIITIFNNIHYLHGWLVSRKILKKYDLFSLINSEAHKYIELVEMPIWMKKEGVLIYKKRFFGLFAFCFILRLRHFIMKTFKRD